jgi:hypothetical protein
MFILILKKYSRIGLILDFTKKTFIVGMKFKIKGPKLKKKRQKNNPFVFVFFKKSVSKSGPPFFISRRGKS